MVLYGRFYRLSFITCRLFLIVWFYRETKKGGKREKRVGCICHSNTNHARIHARVHTKQLTLMLVMWDYSLSSYKYVMCLSVSISPVCPSPHFCPVLVLVSSLIWTDYTCCSAQMNEWMNLIGTCGLSTCTIQDKRQKSNKIIETCPEGVEA